MFKKIVMRMESDIEKVCRYVVSYFVKKKKSLMWVFLISWNNLFLVDLEVKIIWNLKNLFGLV